jgi:hypothetical protein
MAKVTEQHEKLAAESKWDFSDLSALFINCTLKRSPEVSNTRGLADLAVAIMQLANTRSARDRARSLPHPHGRAREDQLADLTGFTRAGRSDHR